MSRPLQPAFPWSLSPIRTRLAAQLTMGKQARTRDLAYALTLIVLTCVGFALRLGLLDAFPLREDEAIYGYWARSATTDPFFLQVWPDKPPLFIWLLTGAFALFGPSEAAARLVSIFASTLTIPLLAIGARRLWRTRLAALMAALLLALNPYAVSFAPTAYTDSLLVLLGTGAVVLALGEPRNLQGLGAGLLLGAACMTKQQGIFYLPLVFALLWSARWKPGFGEKPHPNPPQTGEGTVLPARREGSLPESLQLGGKRHPYRAWLGEEAMTSARRLGSLRYQGRVRVGFFLLGVALIIIPILLWDSQRWDVAPSPWDLAQRTYAPLTLLPPQQWPARALAWVQWLWYLSGSWTVWGMVAAAGSVAIGMAWRRPRLALVIGWGGAFVGWHVITSVQVWDRYLLPLAPWLALVVSGPLALAWRAPLRLWWRWVLLFLLAVGTVGLIRPGIEAAQGQIPIGGDHGDYTGLTAALAWVEDQGQSQQGQGQAGSLLVLYHQALGWHFRFYLYEALQPSGDVPPRIDLRWFPSVPYLADNAAKTPYPPKYLIAPDWATPRDLALHLALRGLVLEPRLRAGRFTVLEIVQPSRPLCEWCMSRAPVLPLLFYAEPPFTPQERTVPILPTVPQVPMP